MTQARRITATEAAAMVQSGYCLDYGITLNQPDVFDKALAARAAELKDVRIRSCISVAPRAVLEADPEGKHFYWLSWHYSGYDRKKSDQSIAHYAPINLGELPDYYRRFIEPADIACIKVCPKDENGIYNFGGTNLWHPAICETARLVIVEVTEGLPYTYGQDCGLHENDIDFIIEGDNAPATELPDLPVTDIDRAVGQIVAENIEDGSCIQVGIGGMPNAVCSALLKSGAKELGLHSEMLTDSMVDLVRSGQATGSRKSLDTGKHVYGFALGSKRLYDTINNNPDFHCCQADYTNPPHIIMQNSKTVAINNTTQIDLTGQAASESDGFRHISGTGGQLQFVRGAYASEGGKSFICLSSVYEKAGVRKSRIVLTLTPGNTVTTTRMDQMYVVTEYGMVNLKGMSIAERVRAMISIAHPEFRDELEKKARENNLIGRTAYALS